MSIDFPDEVAGYPFFPVEFDKRAHRVDDAQVDAVMARVRGGGVTDLVVLAHGWNNDERQALRLYKNLMGSVAGHAGRRLDDRTVAVLGVFWPSKKFADEELIAGGVAAFGSDLPESALVAEIEALRGVFDIDDADQVLDELATLVPDLEDDPAARTRFGDLTRSLLADDAAEDKELGDEIPDEFFAMPGEEIITALSVPRDEELAAGDGAGGVVAVGGVANVGGVGGGVGGAAGLGDFFQGMRSGARTALNLITYWKMKRRAGKIGQQALAPLLRELRGEDPDLKFHLVGHSFGGRLIAAAALGEDDNDPALPVTSATLLQAAFSHNGFAEAYEPGKDGYFRDVVTDARISGPLLITYTSNDRANRWAYPAASRLARQKAAEFGGPDDVYGAIGANGAQHTPGTIKAELLNTGDTYRFQAGKIYNLEASAYIADHGDVTGQQVGHAIVSTIATT